MRENLLVLVALLGLMLPFLANAGGHKVETRIEKRVIVMEGADESELADIMAMVEEEVGGERDVEAYVTKDETGEIRMEKRPADHGGHAIKRMRDIDRGGPGMHAAHHGKPMKMERMSEDAADCVLKNIKNASSDLAVMAVVKACSTLSPLE